MHHTHRERRVCNHLPYIVCAGHQHAGNDERREQDATHEPQFLSMEELAFRRWMMRLIVRGQRAANVVLTPVIPLHRSGSTSKGGKERVHFIRDGGGLHQRLGNFLA
jgi:hypothetical protein